MLVKAGVVVDFAVFDKQGRFECAIEYNGPKHFVFDHQGDLVQSSKEEYRRRRMNENRIPCVHLDQEEWSEQQERSRSERLAWMKEKLDRVLLRNQGSGVRGGPSPK